MESRKSSVSSEQEPQDCNPIIIEQTANLGTEVSDGSATIQLETIFLEDVVTSRNEDIQKILLTTMPFEVCFDGELSAGRVMIKVHCAFQQSRFTKLTTAVYDGCACHIPDGSEFTYAAKEHFISRRSGAVGKRLINCIRQCALQHCRGDVRYWIA